MLKRDLEKLDKEMIAAGVVGGLVLFAALIAAFRTLPEHPWLAVFALLYVGQLFGFLTLIQRRLAMGSSRLGWIESLTQRFALMALHRGEREEYDSDNAFWREMRRMAVEEVEDEDGIQEADAKLDGAWKPRAIWSIVGMVFGTAFTVFFAWLLSSI